MTGNTTGFLIRAFAGTQKLAKFQFAYMAPWTEVVHLGPRNLSQLWLIAKGTGREGGNGNLFSSMLKELKNNASGARMGLRIILSQKDTVRFTYKNMHYFATCCSDILETT